MGIKLDPENPGTYIVSYAKRHPVTRVPVVLRRKAIKTKSEARRVFNLLIVEVSDRLKELNSPKWKIMIQQFVEAGPERGLTPKTVENYRLGLEAHTIHEWGDRRTDTIRTEEIRALILDHLSHRSPNQQKNVLKFIRAVFNYAAETGAVTRNPTPQMKFRVGDKIKGVLTEKQIEILLNKSKELECEWYPHWAMAIYTGMRNGELYALTWDKVNLEDRKILVDCSWNNTDGFKSTKSGDDRIVEIAPPLISVMGELKLKNSDSNFVLPRLDKWDKGEQARELRMFLMGLGLPRIRFHDLRASWATVMLAKGVEPIKVMIMGGWKEMKTMMIYMRKAGVEIRSITDDLRLHNPSREAAKVFQIGARSEL